MAQSSACVCVLSRTPCALLCQRAKPKGCYLLSAEAAISRPESPHQACANSYATRRQVWQRCVLLNIYLGASAPR